MTSNRFKFFLSLILVASSVFLISSCGDDESAVNNSFTFDGNKIAAKIALFNYDPTASESPVDNQPYHRHYLYLLGPGYSVDGSTVTGSGDKVELAISGASANLDAGTYVFTGTENDPKAFELWDGWVYIGEDEYVFGAATLVITESGNKFTINFTATAYPPTEDGFPDLNETGKVVTGKYTGTTVNILND